MCVYATMGMSLCVPHRVYITVCTSQCVHHCEYITVRTSLCVHHCWYSIYYVHCSHFHWLPNTTTSMMDPGWRIWGKSLPPLTLTALLLIKLTLYVRQRSVYKTHEYAHLLAFITNSPETKVKLAAKLSPCNTFVSTKCL